jgi:hypothetical protein
MSREGNIGIYDRLLQWFSRPRAVVFIIVAGVLLCATSLTGGLALDDHVHQLMARGAPGLPMWQVEPYDMYSIVPYDPDVDPLLHESGIRPWWSSKKFKATFMRPLTSLTLYLDHFFWPDLPWLMHVHSLLWLGLMLVTVILAYRRFLGSGALAVLAFALYALNDDHSMPASWVANRNSLICTAAVILALAFHDRWRSAGWKIGALAAPLFFLVGLLAGEFAIGFLAYLLAYAVFIDRDKWTRRIYSLAPYALLTVTWRVAYQALGYGTSHSDFYIDPMSDSLRFTFAAAMRLPILLLDQFGFVESSLSTILTKDGKLVHSIAGCLFTGLFLIAVLPVLKKSAVARFFSLGMLLSLVPVCATFPHARLLILSNFGGMGLVALMIDHYFKQLRLTNGPKPTRIMAVFVWMSLVVHLVVSPIMLPIKSMSMRYLGQIVGHAAASIRMGDNFENETLVIVNGPDFFSSSFTWVWRSSMGLPNPAKICVLTTSVEPVYISQKDNHTLVLRCDTGFANTISSPLIRASDDEFKVGDRFELGNVFILVLAMDRDNHPTMISAKFNKPIQSAKYHFVTWEGNGWVDFELPSSKETVVRDIDGVGVFLDALTVHSRGKPI